MLEHLHQHLGIFVCPRCGSRLTLKQKNIRCLNHHRFKFQHGIPLMFVSHQASSTNTTSRIKQFYEQTPFPNYAGLEKPADLIDKAEANPFLKALNREVSFNTRILEVGCGTGQLSNFLGLAHRYLFATDISLNSLKLGQEFKTRHQLNRVGFYQMNLFRPIFKPQTFSVVIANGVLHHTEDPFSGFQAIADLVEPGGFIVLGLYHRYGRLLTHLRRLIFKVTGNRFWFLDPQLRLRFTPLQRQAWLLDQYYNPHESSHTLKEVQAWFNQADIEFVTSLPQLKAFSPYLPENLFAVASPGHWLDHLYVNLKLMATCSREGGVFIIIGRR